jgi:uncharacterized protein (DUF488 family)
MRFYAETLSKLDPATVYSELGESAILLCYERSEEFCHRHLVAKWLSMNLLKSIRELGKHTLDDFMENNK